VVIFRGNDPINLRLLHSLGRHGPHRNERVTGDESSISVSYNAGMRVIQVIMWVHQPK
jgi:hypothetical protein